MLTIYASRLLSHLLKVALDIVIIGLFFPMFAIINPTLANFVECPPNISIDVVDISNNDNLALATWNRGAVSLWNVVTGEQIHIFQHSDNEYITDVAFSPDDNLIATATRSSAKVWDIESAELLWEFPRNVELEVATGVAFLLDGRRLIVSGYDGASVWNLRSGTKEHFFTGLMDSRFNQSAFISPNNQFIATSDYERNQAYVWSISSGSLVHTFTEDQINSFRAISFTSGDEVVVKSRDAFTFWSTQTWELVRTLNVGDNFTEDWIISPDARYLLTWQRNNGDPQIDLWNLLSNRKIHQFERYFNSSQAIFLESSGELVFWSTQREEIDSSLSVYVWDEGLSTLEIDLQDSIDNVSAFDYASSNAFWIVGTQMSKVLVVDPQSGDIIQSFC